MCIRDRLGMMLNIAALAVLILFGCHNPFMFNQSTLVLGYLLLYGCLLYTSLVTGSKGKRFVFEEGAYLLLFGELPTDTQLMEFQGRLSDCKMCIRDRQAYRCFICNQIKQKNTYKYTRKFVLGIYL